jgi:ATP-dependent RNA helicase RhlE
MEEFEAPRRDTKGRLINPDDEEARRAAREKRAGERGTGKPLPVQAARDKRMGKPGTGKPLREQTEQKKASKPIRKPKQDLKERLQEQVPEEHSKLPEPVIRRNPLDGDVIMDATARLLASKPIRKPIPDSESLQKKPSGGKQTVQGQKTGKLETTGEKKKKPEGGRSQRQRPQPTGTNRPRAEKQQVSPAPMGDEKNEQKQTPIRSEAKGRGIRRNVPTFEGPRSHQKDSTEQPSLMKPFYIKHD